MLSNSSVFTENQTPTEPSLMNSLVIGGGGGGDLLKQMYPLGIQVTLDTKWGVNVGSSSIYFSLKQNFRTEVELNDSRLDRSHFMWDKHN